MDTISESVLSTELQELYLQNKEWMSQVLFLTDESRFFQKLFEQNLLVIGINNTSSQVDLVGATLEKQRENILNLKNLILKHQQLLEHVLKDPEQKVSILLIEEHAAITSEVQELLLSDRIIKSELFMIVESWKNMIGANYVSEDLALAQVKSGSRVFIHGGAATPICLIEALQKRSHQLKDIELVSITTLGGVDFDKPEYKDTFYFNSLFVSAATRNIVNSENGDYVPIFLSQIPQLFRKNILPIDVALIQVSPPDLHGYCSLGTSVDIAKSAVEMAKHVIAQVNPLMPRTHGDGFVHISKIDTLVWYNAPLPEVNYENQLNEVVKKIGFNVASLIEDGATLQMGIGGIPDQVLKNLTNHKDLGIHTEMFSDGIIPLIKKGVVNNSKKKLNIGRSVTSFITGTRKLYDFVNDNPSIRVMDIGYVNDTSVIRQNPKVTAINSAIEIDLTGQVCSDSIGTLQYSGIGGQMDFIHGASLSEGGKPIIAIPSQTNKGISRIVPFLKEGAGVVTTRGHVHWIVTEYGMVNLFGKSLKQRARALIEIAHPNHKEMLESAYSKRFMSFHAING